VMGVQQSMTNVTLNGVGVPSSCVSYNSTSQVLSVVGLKNATAGGAWAKDWVMEWA